MGRVPARTCLLLLLTEEELLGVRPDLRRRARADVLRDRFDVLPAVSLHGVHKQPVLLGRPVSRLRRGPNGARGSEDTKRSAGGGGGGRNGTLPRRGGGGGRGQQGRRLRRRRGWGEGEGGELLRRASAHA